MKMMFYNFFFVLTSFLLLSPSQAWLLEMARLICCTMLLVYEYKFKRWTSTRWTQQYAHFDSDVPKEINLRNDSPLVGSITHTSRLYYELLICQILRVDKIVSFICSGLLQELSFADKVFDFASQRFLARNFKSAQYRNY